MLPANVSTGRVEGRFIVGVEDGPDPDDFPDFVAAQGTIEFTASVPYLPNPTAVPAPVTMLKTAIRGVLDAEGYLCTMLADGSPGVRGVRLVATDDPDLLVQNWTWAVTYRFTPVNGSTPAIAAHSIALASDTTQDLTTAIKVPASPGVGLPQAEAAVIRAAAAATDSAQSSADAEAAALDVVTRANSGEFKGDQGLPGNATMRVDTTVGTRVFITDGVTERLISADTGLRGGLLPLYLNGATQTADGNAARLSRENNLVTLYLTATVTDWVAGNAIFNVPLGFRPPSQMSMPPSYSVAGAAIMTSLGDIRLYQTGSNTYRWLWSWRTKDSWPTTLPGNPS